MSNKNAKTIRQIANEHGIPTDQLMQACGVASGGALIDESTAMLAWRSYQQKKGQGQQATTPNAAPNTEAPSGGGMVGEVAHEIIEHVDFTAMNLALMGKTELRNRTGFYYNLPEATVRELIANKGGDAPTEGRSFQDFFSTHSHQQTLTSLLGSMGVQTPALTAAGTHSATNSSEQSTLLQDEKLNDSEGQPN